MIQVLEYVGNSALHDSGSLYYASDPSEEDLVVDSVMSVDNILGAKYVNGSSLSTTYWKINTCTISTTYWVTKSAIRLVYCINDLLFIDEMYSGSTVSMTCWVIITAL